MKQGMTLTDLAAEVERQAAAKMDFIASTDQLTVQSEWKPQLMTSEDDTSDRSNWGEVKLVVTGEDAPDDIRGRQFSLTKTAHQQLGDKVGVPKKYYDRMLEEAPHLLAQNLNHWLHHEPQRRMVRTLDEKARSILTERYQRRDNFELMQYLLPALMQPGEDGLMPWRFESQALTEDHLHFKLVHSWAAKITTVRGVDDIVHAGIAIRNSEVGRSALAIEPMLWWKWCLNGCITRRYSQRKVHLGRKQGGDDPVAIMLSDETKQLEDAAFFAKARDVIAYFANPETFQTIVTEIEQTTDRQLVGKVEKGVEILSNMIGLQSGETEGVLRNLINNSDRYGLTQYGLLNAITRMAQDVEDYDRATMIEASADTIIDLNPSQWREIAEAA